MKCPRCRHENEARAKFCEECAAPLARTCANCGRQLSPTAKFCPECAHATGSASEAPTAARFTSPESYTPKHLAEKILTSKAALEGERKQVTVLFADLKGSMELLADRDPEEARKLLDPVLERMMEAVHRYEGTVNQVMGDGIMALFGAPLAHEDHAVRACYAALRMQESVAQYADSVFRSHGVPVEIRVGLNSGEVVVRAIGSDLHMDYTAVGQTTHLAARMEQMATPGTILLAPATLQLAEGYVQVAARGPVAVRGLPHPVEIYALNGASAQRTRLHAAAARGLTRFVGRDAEIEKIQRALALAHVGHGQIVAIVGEPGVGKSRLVYEFTHSHRAQDWLIMEAGSVPYGKSTSYLPVVDLLKAYFKVDDRETHREIREKVTGRLFTLDRTLEPTLPALLALLDVPVEAAHWHALDPAQRRQRTLDAVKHLLLRESQARPVLVVFEDLHWIDAETQALLDGLVESLPTARLVLLANYRPEYRDGWVSKTYHSQLRLDALPPESAGELLSALLGDDPELEPLKRLLVKRGNPFFIEESIRTLVETGALTRERGVYCPTRPIQAIEVPATVQVILAARIDRLPSDDKQLLQTASVIGKDVPFVLLHAVAESAEDAVQRGLTHLQAAEFLYETRVFPDPEYTFKHALTHEVTYGTLLQERRKVLHARIVGAIERLYADRLTEHVERLAHHAVRGEVWEQALRYLRQAGARAVACSANREAGAYFEQALHVLQHLPEGRSKTEDEYELRIYRVAACYSLGEFGRAVDYLDEAEALARALEDQTRLARVAVLMLACLAPMGSQARAIESGVRALAIAEAVGNLPLHVTATILLGFAHIGLGDFPRAIAYLRKSAALLEGQPVHKRLGQIGLPAVFWRAWLIPPLAEVGAFPEAITRGEEAVRIAEAAAQPYSLALVHGTLGHLYCVKGEPSSGIPVLERAVALCRDYELTVLSPFTIGSLGHAYAMAGRVAEALPLMEQAVAQGASLRVMWWQSRRMTQLGEGYLLAGRPNDAMATAERALALADAHGERASRAYALRFLAEIAFRRDPPDIESAEHHLLNALALAEELGMRPLVARCQLDIGRSYRREGKRQNAEEHLRAATTMFGEMEMRFWLAQAAAEMKAVA